MTIGYDQLKDVAKVLREADKIEQYNMILEAQQQLLDMQAKIRKLEGQKQDLEKKLQTRDSLKYRNEAYWSENSDGSEDGPFCAPCWDSTEKLIRTKVYQNAVDRCPVCGQYSRVRV